MDSFELIFGMFEILFLIGVFLLFSIATIIGIYHYSYLLGDDVIIIFAFLTALILVLVRSLENNGDE